MSICDEGGVALFQQGDHLLTTTAARSAIDSIPDRSDVPVIRTSGWRRAPGNNLIVHRNYLIFSQVLHCADRYQILADNEHGCMMGNIAPVGQCVFRLTCSASSERARRHQVTPPVKHTMAKKVTFLVGRHLNKKLLPDKTGIRRVELLLVVVGAIIVAALADRRGTAARVDYCGDRHRGVVCAGFPHSGTRFARPARRHPAALTLFSAAVNFSFPPTFIRNIRPILGLGVALVMVTAFAVAAVSAWLVVVPLTFGGALVLGAIVAPPDAVTAVAIGRRLGLPKKVMAVLTGESLINDAAALVLFSVAVAQVTGSHTFIANPALLFGYAALLGSAVGAVLGYATLWIRRSLNNPALETVQGLVAPFAAFLLAENVHASGVLAVVAAGFVVGSGTLAAGYQTRLQERYVWNSLDVLLEAFVFAYIGLHLRFVLDDLNEAHESLTSVGLASMIVLAVVVLIRPLSVFVMFGPWLLFQYRDRVATPPGAAA